MENQFKIYKVMVKKKTFWTGKLKKDNCVSDTDWTVKDDSIQFWLDMGNCLQEILSLQTRPVSGELWCSETRCYLNARKEFLMESHKEKFTM